MGRGLKSRNEIWKIVKPPTKEFLKIMNVLHLTSKNHQSSLKLRNQNKSGNEEDNSKESLISNRMGEVPKGYLAVYVGSEMQRYVIPAIYLSFEEIRVLMDRVADEFGYEQQEEGGLRIPCCEEDDFDQILVRCFEEHQKMKKKKSGKV